MISPDALNRLKTLGVTPSAASLSSPPPEVAPSSFSTGPKDDVATADIYQLGKDATKTITSVKDLVFGEKAKLGSFLNEGKDELSGFLDKTRNAGGDLFEFMVKEKDSDDIKFNESILTRRLLETSSEIKGAFSDLTDGIKNNAKLNISKQKIKDIKCVVNDVQCAISATKIKDVKALGGFINKYTKSSVFSTKDTGALSGLLASVVEKSEELGVKGAYTSLMSTIQDNSILRMVTKTLVPIAIAKNYPNLLRQISTSEWGKAVNIFMPGATSSLLKNFSLTTNRNTKPINSFEDLLITLDGVSTGWSRATREGSDEDIFNIANLMGGSKDFQRLLVSGVQHFYSAQSNAGAGTRITTPNGAQMYALYGLAAHYQQTTAAAACRRFFPAVALTGTYDTTVPRMGVANSRSSVRSAQSSIVDARLLTHAVTSLFG